MSYPQEPHLAIIGARRQQRLAPVIKTVTYYIAEEKVRFILVLAFFAAHVPLAILMFEDDDLATLHAFVSIIAALGLAVFSKKSERVAYAAAYITGSEVLWRMTGSQSFWELGKYGVAATFIIAMVRNRNLKPALLPVLYFVLLLPSALLTYQSFSFGEFRSLVSGNLSGPFALMITGCFFSQISMTRERLVRMLLSLMGPIVGIAAVAAFGISTAEDLVFTSESSFGASGGFGPNQVSAILGLGALAGFLILLDRNVDYKVRVLCGAAILFFAAQSALTFSRGGIYNALGAIILASLFLLKDSQTRVQFLLAILLVSALSYFVVFPKLDDFTDGALSARFEDTGMTGRDEIARADLAIWLDNPILGVGPGVAKEYRAIEVGRPIAAHTEFTRLLAEHGIFGLIVILAFGAAAVINLLRARTAAEKALVMSLMAWSFFYMLNAAMRLVAPAMMFGLAFAHLLASNYGEQSVANKRSSAFGSFTLSRFRFNRAVRRSL